MNITNGEMLDIMIERLEDLKRNYIRTGFSPYVIARAKDVQEIWDEFIKIVEKENEKHSN